MRRSRAAFGRWLLVLLLTLGVAGTSVRGAKSDGTRAKLSVDGVGALRDRDLRAALTRLLGTELKATLDANAIEDAAVILWSTLGMEGFQRPEITIEVVLEDGATKQFTFDPTFAIPLPR